MKAFRSALDVLKRARRPYIALNLIYYGLVVCGMVYVTFDRPLQQSLAEAVITSFSDGGPLASVLEAYSTGKALQAIAMTFGINLVVATLLFITVPSLIVPFGGLLLAGLRALVWGALFAPQFTGQIEGKKVLAWVLFLILLFLEGEGYVLAALGAYLHGRAFLWPRRLGLAGPGQGYLHGLKEQARVYLWVVVVLLIAAVYEVWVAVVTLPALQ
jgi:hypothetical protein